MYSLLISDIKRQNKCSGFGFDRGLRSFFEAGTAARCSNQRQCGLAESEWGYGDEGNAL